MIAEMQAVNDQANKLIADHLEHYVQRLGSDATYEGWIGILHPENVTLDARLSLPDSAHLRLWNERPRATTADGEQTFWQAVTGLARSVTGDGRPKGRPGKFGSSVSRTFPW